MRSIWTTALGASAEFLATPALAQAPRYTIDVRAVEVVEALTSLAVQTGVSFAYDARPPRTRVRPIRGRMTIEQAFKAVLEPAGFQAIAVGPRAFRIVVRRQAAVSKPTEVPSPPAGVDIVVTARKRAELVSGLAAPFAAYRPEEETPPGGASSRDVAQAMPGLSLSNAGPGRERLFIRGVADSPLNGFSQSTVSVHLDDTRVTFDGTDPGLRLVDVARVEVLKGPQGPLYGTGALGGVYRIVTNRPVLGRVEAAVGIGALSRFDTMFGSQATAMLNLPLIEDRLAIRMTGYSVVDPGWINDVDGRTHVNRVTIRGGRASARIVPFEGWRVDVSFLQQETRARDSQYVNLPGGTLARNVPIGEPRGERTRVFQAAITGSIGTLPISLSSGMSRRQQFQIDDASAIAPVLGFTPPVRFVDSRSYQIVDHELRIGSAPGSGFGWVAGASFLLARTDRAALWYGTSSEVQNVNANRRVTEAALYLDGSVSLARRIRAGGGVRVFRTTTKDDRFAFDTVENRSRTLFGVTPNASLSYEITADSIVFARFATALRAGGLDPTNTATRRFEPDNVRTLDIGGRFRASGGGLAIDGDVFVTDWADVQADYLERSGLISTRNVGRAAILGAEASVEWTLARGWRVSAGGILQRARLVEDMRRTTLPRPSRLPIVPDVAARLSLERVFAIDGWTLSPTVVVNAYGSASLGLDPELDRRMPAYAAARFGAGATRGGLTLRLDIDNLFDTHADTFGLGNPFSVRSERQTTPYRPRTLSISASRRF